MVSSMWKRSGYPAGTSGSTSEPNLASAQPDPQPGQSSGEQMPQQPALLAPPRRSRRRRVVDKVKGLLPSSSPSPSPSLSPSPSPSPGTGRLSEARPIATPTPQSLMVPANAVVRPHSSYLGASTQKAYDTSPLTTGNDVTAVSSGNYGSPSSLTFIPISTPSTKYSYVSSNLCCEIWILAKIDVHTAVLPEAKPTPGPSTTEPLLKSSVWTSALKLAEQKLRYNKLPPINLNSDPAEENIGSIIKALKNVQGDDKKNSWIGEHFGKILKCVEKYSKIVDIAIQANPQVAALVWAGIWGMIRVCTYLIDCVRNYSNLHG